MIVSVDKKESLLVKKNKQTNKHVGVICHNPRKGSLVRILNKVCCSPIKEFHATNIDKHSSLRIDLLNLVLNSFLYTDTAFMYIIAGLGMLKLYQQRHQDVNANAHAAYACLAIVIFLAMLGVVRYKNKEEWLKIIYIHNKFTKN